MGNKQDLERLKLFLESMCPQEWLISHAEMTTCNGPTDLLIVDSEPYPTSERELIGLIEFRGKEIVITSPNILSDRTQKIAGLVRPLTGVTFPGTCLTLSECPLNCPECANAAQFYQEPVVFPGDTEYHVSP